MNSDPNSDSKQCTVPKLGRVHSAQAQNPGCARTVSCRARTPHAGRRVAARTAPCRNVHSAVSQRTRRPLSRYKNRIATPLWPGRALQLVPGLRPGRVAHRVATLCCGPQHAGQAMSRPGACLRLACRDTTHCIVTQNWKMGNSPSSFSPAPFFFFFCSTHCKTMKKKFQIFE